MRKTGLLRLLFLTFALSGCATPQWTVHKDPRGFSVELPHGWSVASDANSGRVVIDGPQQRVIVWPVFVPGAVSVRSAPAVLERLAAASLGGSSWGPARPAGASAVRSEGRWQGRAAVAAFAWVPSPQGAAGYFYATAAPQAAYRGYEETFARILASFRITGAPVGDAGGAAAAPAVHYVRWTDPREGAFSFEVPEGWQISGGLHRLAPVDVRSVWQAVSPDGIRISGGDAELPLFTEPDQMLAMAGLREGSWYSPGYGINRLVQRYLPGVVFAREYVRTRVSRRCPELEITGERDRPDTAAALNSANQQPGAGGITVRLSAGEVTFTCRESGRSMRGYYFAGTQRTQVPGMPGGPWNVEHLFGVIAPEAKVELARAVAEHILKSSQINPQWMAMQQNITAETSRIVSRTNTAISSIITSTHENRQTVMDELSRRRSNATLGVEDVVDSTTGRSIKVESGSDYYWIDHRGTIVGTNTDTRPDLDFRTLTRLP
jgi:hypothetical protein